MQENLFCLIQAQKNAISTVTVFGTYINNRTPDATESLDYKS